MLPTHRRPDYDNWLFSGQGGPHDDRPDPPPYDGFRVHHHPHGWVSTEVLRDGEWSTYGGDATFSQDTAELAALGIPPHRSVYDDRAPVPESD